MSDVSLTADVECAHDKLTEDEQRVVLLELIGRFMSFYKSLSVAQLDALMLLSYNTDIKQHKTPHEFNMFLVTDAFKLQFNDILKDKALYTLLMDTRKLIAPQYRHLSKFIRLNPSTIKLFIEDYVNKFYVAPINLLTSLFTKMEEKHKQYLADGIVLYKGLWDCFIKGKQIGDEIIFENFLSATLSRRVAKQYYANYYASQKAAAGQTCICELVGLGGQQYIYVLGSRYSATGDKLEKQITDAWMKPPNAKMTLRHIYKWSILLPRNMKFKLVKISEIPLIESVRSAYNKEPENELPTYKEYMASISGESSKSEMPQTATKKKKGVTQKHTMIKVYHLEFVEQQKISRIPRWHIPQDFKMSL
jgi:hypothetical protein